MVKITKRVVESTLPDPEKPVFIWDDQMKGFAVKVLRSGQRKYVLKYRGGGGGRSGRQRWFAIGTHGQITLHQARDIAQQILGQIARGEDPQSDKFDVRAAANMSDLWARYKSDHLPRKKPKSQKVDIQMWRTHVKPRFGTTKVMDVKRNDIDKLHKSLSDRPYTANRVVAMLSKMFNLAERWDMRADYSNPCRHIEKYPEPPRKRYLNTEELRRLGEALEVGLASQLETPYMVAAVRLLLLTGARVRELLDARWEWLDWDRRTIDLPDSKTGARSIFLSQAAVDVLKGLRKLPTTDGTPFIIRGRIKKQPLTNLNKPWLRIRERAGLEGVRLHDLRHTAASMGVTQGLNLPVIGRLLGHTQASTTQRYAHVDINPALAAADLIGDAMAPALGIVRDDRPKENDTEDRAHHDRPD